MWKSSIFQQKYIENILKIDLVIPHDDEPPLFKLLLHRMYELSSRNDQRGRWKIIFILIFAWLHFCFLILKILIAQQNCSVISINHVLKFSSQPFLICLLHPEEHNNLLNILPLLIQNLTFQLGHMFSSDMSSFPHSQKASDPSIHRKPKIHGFCEVLA